MLYTPNFLLSLYYSIPALRSKSDFTTHYAYAVCALENQLGKFKARPFSPVALALAMAQLGKLYCRHTP